MNFESLTGTNNSPYTIYLPFPYATAYKDHPFSKYLKLFYKHISKKMHISHSLTKNKMYTKGMKV